MIQVTTPRSTITGNEDYALPWAKSDTEQLIEWDIVVGSATVEVGVISNVGAFRKSLLLDGTAPVFSATSGSCVIETPGSGQACIKVSGAAGLSMVVNQTVKPRRK